MLAMHRVTHIVLDELKCLLSGEKLWYNNRLLHIASDFVKRFLLESCLASMLMLPIKRFEKKTSSAKVRSANRRTVSISKLEVATSNVK